MEAKSRTVEEEPDMTYSKELRKATKDVHKISDALVNAKFALALSDESVWSDSLLCFYEVYKYLETHLSEEWIPNELRRTEAFQKDLTYFFGENWKNTYQPRDSIQKYIAHLDEVRERGGDVLLFAYAFQMYMALMSGGQLLQKKRLIARKLWISKSEQDNSFKLETSPSDLESRPMPVQVNICAPGCEATYFSQEISILKAKLRNILNREYPKFDDTVRSAFIEESRNVFIYNSEIIRSVRGVNRANIRKVLIVTFLIIGVYCAYKFAKC